MEERWGFLPHLECRAGSGVQSGIPSVILWARMYRIILNLWFIGYAC